MPSGKKFGYAGPSQSIEAEEDIELLFNRITERHSENGPRDADSAVFFTFGGTGKRAPAMSAAIRSKGQPATVHDIHATILNLLGMDHKRLTYFFNGRHMRLTDVHGELIPEIAGV